MMGPDLERITMVLSKLHDECCKQIHALARESDHRLETIDHSHNTYITGGAHGHGSGDHSHSVPGIAGPTGATGGDGYGSRQLTYVSEYTNDKHGSHPHILPFNIYEREHPVAASTYVNPIVAIGVELGTDQKKMHHIESNQYTDRNTFNNSYGSPYEEVDQLKMNIDNLEAYANEYPDLQWIGEKQSLLHLIQVVLTMSVNAKWSIITYQDWMQGAYDQQFNDNVPSLTWDSFASATGKTIGNVNQVITGAVGLPPIIMDSFENIRSKLKELQIKPPF